MSRQLIRGVHTSMLSTCASKTHHQALKSTFDVIFNGNIHKVKYAIQELTHSCLLFEIIDYAFVSPVHGLELLDATRIENSPAIKNKSAAVATIILRYFLSV
jgi:hypothetical protein